MKIRISDATESHDLDLPVTIDVLQSHPPPAPHPIVEEYWDNAVRLVDDKPHYDKTPLYRKWIDRHARQSDQVVPGSSNPRSPRQENALYACGNGYDGPKVYEMFSRLLPVRGESRGECLDHAALLIRDGWISHCLTPPDGIADKLHAGAAFSNHTDGLAAMIPRMTMADWTRRAINTLIAKAYLNGFAHPHVVKPGATNFEKAEYARPFSLVLQAFVNALPYHEHEFAKSLPEYMWTKRLKMMDHILDTIIPKHVEWFNWASHQEPMSLVTPQQPWQSFMLAHCAKGIIAWHRNGFDDTRNAWIEKAVPVLCDAMWTCYREVPAPLIRLPASLGTVWGLYLAGNVADVPAPDVSGWCMPAFAWAYKVTGTQKYFDQAIRLLESALRFAHPGQKQFQQTYNWSYEGLQWLGLVD
jgi:hypothetical protein